MCDCDESHEEVQGTPLVIKRDLTWGVRIIRKGFPGDVMGRGERVLQRS